MTGLHLVLLHYYCHTYITLLTQYCTELTKIAVFGKDIVFDDILSLSLLQELQLYLLYGLTDTALLELTHACPHLHTLYLPFETEITDIGILALSEHCPQLQQLEIYRCNKVTEAAVLQLLQRCHKLTRLEVSSSSLSEETWTQLDKNIQKRVKLHK